MVDIKEKMAEEDSKGLVIEILFEGKEIKNNIIFKNMNHNEIIGLLETLKQKFIETQMKTADENSDLLYKLK